MAIILVCMFVEKCCQLEDKYTISLCPIQICRPRSKGAVGKTQQSLAFTTHGSRKLISCDACFILRPFFGSFLLR